MNPFFFPDEGRHSDARHFFAEVPTHFTSVRFTNFEAIPENMDVEDPFTDVTLFKVNPALLEEMGVEPRILYSGEVAEEDQNREPNLFGLHNSDTAGALQHGFVRLPRRTRHALRRLLSLMHQVAEIRHDVLANLGICFDVENPPRALNRESGPDYSDDESCYFPRPCCPSFFNSYSNGKCAVRTRIGPDGEPPPLPAGVHGFVRDNCMPLFTLVCKGPGAPVILHYANCGYTSWRKKYDVLCRGHGTKDGAFCTQREGISELLSHTATRQLTLRNDEQDLEQFYRYFVLGNEFDEVPFFAQFGLVVRLDSVRDKLRKTVSVHGHL